nr:bax inhibitor 1-like [Penaeus vannamei]
MVKQQRRSNDETLFQDLLRIHLKNVYATLTLATIAASVGGYAHMFSTFISSGLMTFLSAIWVLILLVFTPYDGKNQLQRLSLLGIFAFLTGCNLGPFLNLAVTINPALVLQALLGASVIFACFSLSALYAPDGHYLYLRGTLMSANLYIGLAVMCGFIVYDTQFIVERARRGDMDYVMHSLNLFVDFVGVFWRLLMILTNKARGFLTRNESSDYQSTKTENPEIRYFTSAWDYDTSDDIVFKKMEVKKRSNKFGKFHKLVKFALHIQ